jgi:hypothetical protein
LQPICAEFSGWEKLQRLINHLHHLRKTHMTTEACSSTQTTNSASGSDHDSCPTAAEIGASGDVDKAAEHVRCNPGDRAAVEQAMLDAGHVSEVNELAQRLEASGLGTELPGAPNLSLLEPTTPPAADVFGALNLSTQQWAGLNISSMSIAGQDQSMRVVTIGDYSLVSTSSPGQSKTTLVHAQGEGESSSWSVDATAQGLTLASQHADGSGVKHEYPVRGGSLSTYTQAPGWVTESVRVERIGTDGARAVKDSTTYGITLLNVDGTSVTEFDAQGQETARTLQGNLNAEVPYVVAASVGAQGGSNWGLGAKVEALPLGEAANSFSSNETGDSLAEVNVGLQFGVDGFSAVAEGAAVYDKLAGVNFEVTAQRDPMTNATTVATGISAKVANTTTGFSADAGSLTDAAGTEIGGHAQAAASVLGFGLAGGAQTTEDGGRLGFVGVTGPLQSEGGLIFDSQNGTSAYADFNDLLDSKPDLSKAP